MSATPWQEQFTVRAYEADARGVASIQTLCNYVQEIAGNHAFALGLAIDQLMAQGITWVLSRLRVKMDSYPRWRDRLTLTTWPSDANRLYAFRDYEIADTSGARLGAATSAWLLIDLKTRRPIRVPPNVAELPVRDRPRALDDAFSDRLRAPDAPENECRFTVRVSDLDINRHVNLVNYIEWSVESVPAEIRNTRTLRDLLVEFHAEGMFGDEAISQSRAEAGKPGLFAHAVRRSSDGKILALARTEWA